jgi:EAL domain-containing protein (putative c-di-GMP-specific phosphodiesterase class I)
MLGALVAATDVPDGEAYLAQRLPMLASFAAVATALLAPGIEERQYRGTLRAELEAILDERAFGPVFQPVIEFLSGRIVGYEALTRFRDGTRPDRRFADASAVGLGFALETATLAAAIKVGARLPRDVWLSLNVSPALLLDVRRLAATLKSVRRPIFLEISEHDAIEDYAAIRLAATEIGIRARLAVDDAGAGYASFRHILELRPDLVKLDIGLVRGVDADRGRQALVAGIVYFAQKSGCRLVAEGIEQESERAILQELGVDFGQGFLLGRPAVLEQVTPARADPGLDAIGRVGARARPSGVRRSPSPAAT